MNDYEMRRNPQRMTPHELGGLLHTIGDNATDGARLHGTLSWRSIGADETAGFLVQGTVGIDDDTIRVGEWDMLRDPYRWYAVQTFTGNGQDEPPGVAGPDARVVRTTSGPVRLHFHRLPSGTWCHRPEHHLNPRTGEECAGATWHVLINMYGCLEEDI